jgi:hypothetical protein
MPNSSITLVNTESPLILRKTLMSDPKKDLVMATRKN